MPTRSDNGHLCFSPQALIDGPCSGVARRDISFKMLHLTDFVIKIAPSSRKGIVKKAWEKAEITKKWEASSWAKKIESRKKVGRELGTPWCSRYNCVCDSQTLLKSRGAFPVKLPWDDCHGTSWWSVSIGFGNGWVVLGTKQPITPRDLCRLKSHDQCWKFSQKSCRSSSLESQIINIKSKKN